MTDRPNSLLNVLGPLTVPAAPEWPLISSTGVLRHVYRGPPASANTSEEHEDWPYFTSTGVLRSAYRRPPSPVFVFEDSSSSLSVAVGSSAAGYPAASLGRPHTPYQGGSTPYLDNSNHPRGDAPASPRLQCDTRDVTSIAKAVELIQGATTPAEAEDAVSAITSWLSRLPEPEWREAKKAIRFETMVEFTITWIPPMQEDRFMNFDEHEVFVRRKWLPFTDMDSDVRKRFANTARANTISMLLGRLVQSDVLLSAHAVAACEQLFQHHKKDGYMLGLSTLLRSVGDKVCESENLHRMEEIADGMRDAKRKMDLYTVEVYADPIIDMIRSYTEAQAIANPQRGTKRKRE